MSDSVQFSESLLDGLTLEQREAVTGIYGWARRMKSDVDWLIEYGSARSRRLESTGGD